MTAVSPFFPTFILVYSPTKSQKSSVFPYSFVIRLVAVVASSQISNSRDGEATTFGGIRVFLATVVAKALEQAADYILVIADEVGILTDVVSISNSEE